MHRLCTTAHNSMMYHWPLSPATDSRLPYSFCTPFLSYVCSPPPPTKRRPEESRCNDAHKSKQATNSARATEPGDQGDENAGAVGSTDGGGKVIGSDKGSGAHCDASVAEEIQA